MRFEQVLSIPEGKRPQDQRLQNIKCTKDNLNTINTHINLSIRLRQRVQKVSWKQGNLRLGAMGQGDRSIYKTVSPFLIQAKNIRLGQRVKMDWLNAIHYPSQPSIKSDGYKKISRWVSKESSCQKITQTLTAPTITVPYK